LIFTAASRYAQFGTTLPDGEHRSTPEEGGGADGGVSAVDAEHHRGVDAALRAHQAAEPARLSRQSNSVGDSRAVAVEGSRGWKISKEKQPHKIDIVVALGMACLAATETPKSTYDPLAAWVSGNKPHSSSVDYVCAIAAHNGILV
jgi:hypothetical protein